MESDRRGRTRTLQWQSQRGSRRTGRRRERGPGADEYESISAWVCGARRFVDANRIGRKTHVPESAVGLESLTRVGVGGPQSAAGRSPVLEQRAGSCPNGADGAGEGDRSFYKLHLRMTQRVVRVPWGVAARIR